MDSPEQKNETVIHQEEFAEIKDKLLELTYYYANAKGKNRRTSFWWLFISIPLITTFSLALIVATLISVNFFMENSRQDSLPDAFKVTLDNWLNPKLIIHSEKQAAPQVTIQPQDINITPAPVEIYPPKDKIQVFYASIRGSIHFINPNKHMDAVITYVEDTANAGVIRIPYSTAGMNFPAIDTINKASCLNCEFNKLVYKPAPLFSLEQTNTQTSETGACLMKSKFDSVTKRRKDHLSATIKTTAFKHTGSATNNSVRQHVNKSGTRVPDQLTYTLKYKSDNGAAKTRVMTVANPMVKKGERYDAGHLLGQQIGGSGTDVNNLFSQHKAVNRWKSHGAGYTLTQNWTPNKNVHSQRGMEDKVRRKADKYNKVDISVKIDSYHKKKIP